MPPPNIATPTKTSPAPPQRLPPGKGPPAGVWMGQGGRSPGPGMRDPQNTPLSPGLAGLCHQKFSSAARPPALGSEARARPGDGAGQSLTGRGRQRQWADVSIWMGAAEAGLPKRRPSARTLLPHHLCSRRGRTESSPQRQPPAPSVRETVHPASQAPKTPTCPAGEAPPGARHRDYLEWQRSSAIGSVPRPAWVGMEPGTSSRETQKKKKKVVLGSTSGPRLRGFTRTPGCAGARA